MLEPRETDIPALFLVFVFLLLVTYFILGKCSETSKRKERISLIASGAAEEALQVDHMAVGGIMPAVNMPNSVIHQCARCFGPAGTRCSQCKSVWYCQLDSQYAVTNSNVSAVLEDVRSFIGGMFTKDCHRSSLKCGAEDVSRGRVLCGETTEQRASQHKVSLPSIDGTSSKDFIDSSKTAGGAVCSSSGEVCGSTFTLPIFSQPSEDPHLREGNSSLSECHANSPHAPKDGAVTVEKECGNALHSSTAAISGTKTHETQPQMTLRQDKYPDRSKGCRLIRAREMLDEMIH
ncbi:hypothetical protein SASPL_144226 [Salvia splendens]|uniref:Ubiquitin carboxyl-terminal hydrolase 36/42 n=1 Tax=Salvia splendens TaxID=180675 RepID=A0A8X8WMZ3_SALSN|nr:hypothetical protein SASPL_144226 [Salvia splendens]